MQTQCHTADSLEVGQTFERTFSFTHEQVAAYCDLSGDRNGIHRDLEAARLRFPGVADIVVPGGLIQSTISAVFATDIPGDGTIGLSFVPERFRKPVCPGETIRVGFTITRIRGVIVEIDITVDDAEGTRLSTAKAKVVAPDADYRAWWEGQNR